MPPSKKPASKPSAPNAGNSKATHPTWVDMIKECIAVHPEDARAGVSRPTIKKFVESKYHIELTPTTASQLNRAISSGSERGIFVLPKGASGKVKLAPKATSKPHADAAKENAKPVSKKAVPAKPKSVSAKSTASAKATTAKKPASTRAAPKPKSKANPSKKAVSVASKPKETKSKTKAVVKKPGGATGKAATITNAKARAKKPVAKKASTAKKSGMVKKVVVGKAKATKPEPMSAAFRRRAAYFHPSNTVRMRPKLKPASKADAAA